jgi:hypothetical protein
MSKRSTVLKELLRERHWQTYATFCRQYDKSARELDSVLVGRWPSRGQFARWLSGDLKGMPQPDHCRVLEAMFDGYSVRQLFDEATRPRPGLPAAPVHSAGASPSGHVPAARRHEPFHGPESTPSAPPASPGAPAQPHLPAVPTTAGIPSPAGPPALEPLPALRAAPGASLAAQALSEEICMTTEQSARFARRTNGGVDHDVLDQLAADVRQLAIEYLVRPPLTIFRPLSRLRSEVFDLLDQRQRPAVLPPLYAVAGRLCALLAHASADLGHSYAAETHTRTAWLCADLADDDSLRAYVRWVQSNVAYWDGDYRQAATIAHSGQRYATKGSNLLRLASQEARAWAACGQAAEVEQALSVAATARDQGIPDDQAGVFRFDPGKAAYYASEVRLALGGEANARRAVASAQDALTLFEDGPDAQRSPEFVAAARLDLANSHLALSDLEAASGQIRIVLQLPVECRTQPIVGRVRSAAEALQAPAFTSSTLAHDLQEEIALFRAYSAQRDLPEGND